MVNEHQKAYAVLTLVILFAYVNSLWGNFQFSDYNVIVNYPVVHSWSRWFHNAVHGGIRPLLKLSYTMNWMLGHGPLGFHIFNVAVHVINVLMVYEICRKLASAWHSDQSSKAQDGPALLAALLFAVHPMQTEAVTYISGRSSSLMALFYLGSLLAYICGVKQNSRILRFIVSPVLLILAIAVKEVAISLPFVLLLWECTLSRRNWKQISKDLAIHWCVLALTLAAILNNHKYLELLLFSSTIRNMFDNLLSQVNGISYLLSRLFLVYAMNIDPDVPAISSLDLTTSINLFILATCAVFCIRKRNTRPWLLFGLLWFIIVLLPSNSVIPRLDVINERHFYLAGVGIFLAAAMEMAHFRHRFYVLQRSLPLCAVAIIMTLVFFTVLRNKDYRSDVSMWESTMKYSSEKSRVHNNLGYAYAAAGRTGEAATAFRTALKLEPGNETAQKNMKRLGNGATEFNRTVITHNGGAL